MWQVEWCKGRSSWLIICVSGLFCTLKHKNLKKLKTFTKKLGFLQPWKRVLAITNIHH